MRMARQRFLQRFSRWPRIGFESQFLYFGFWFLVFGFWFLVFFFFFSCGFFFLLFSFPLEIPIQGPSLLKQNQSSLFVFFCFFFFFFFFLSLSLSFISEEGYQVQNHNDEPSKVSRENRSLKAWIYHSASVAGLPRRSKLFSSNSEGSSNSDKSSWSVISVFGLFCCFSFI